MIDTHHPHHDVRQLRSHVEALLREVDRLAKRIQDPDLRPDVTDYNAPVTYQGRPYRVVGRTHGPDGTTLRIEPEETTP